MQILSNQEIIEVSGAIRKTRKVIMAASGGLVVGARATGVAISVCPAATTAAVAVNWGLMQCGAALFGGVQILSEIYDYYQSPN